MSERIRVTYRREGGVWQAWLSDGQRLYGGPQLDDARQAVADHLRGGPQPTAEYVQVPEMEGVTWAGLRFEMFAPTFDIDAPTLEQQQQLWDCFEYYRQRLPEGMRVELYGNRVRIEPGAFGQRAQLIDSIGGALADQVPDDLDLQVGPTASGLDVAREQLARARTITVPDGFIRVIHEYAGFEAEGSLGTMRLVLRDRWRLDRPC